MLTGWGIFTGFQKSFRLLTEPPLESFLYRVLCNQRAVYGVPVYTVKTSDLG